MNNRTPRKPTLTEAEAAFAAAVKNHKAACAALLAVHRAGGNDTAAGNAEHAARNLVSIALVNRNAARTRTA